MLRYRYERLQMDYRPKEVYYESDISCSMSNQMNNPD